MTAYMYNPSKKVTELLSKYLEFDHEKLQLGIWSGNLSLSDVQIRKDALYDILNKHSIQQAMDAMKQETSKSDPSANLQPPLPRLKLVTGTIGHLSVKIPWKRLVWGSGDVQAELRNVTIVLSLEHTEDTKEHPWGKNAENDSIYPHHPSSFVSGNSLNNNYYEEELTREDFVDSERPALTREKKQKRLRDAERRHLQGRSLGVWMASQCKKDRRDQANTEVNESIKLKQTQGRIEKWLHSTTSDFFWRFYAGLELVVENLKIIVVQDGVEMGIIIPKSEVVGKDSNATGSRKEAVSPGKEEDAVGQDMGSNAEEELRSYSTPPTNVVYESAFDDGEHIDKAIKNLGVYVYARETKRSVHVEGENALASIDVSNNEYIVRPIDFNVEYSFFYPYPPEKRKSLKKVSAHISNDGSADGSTAGGSASSYKNRRGKREKSVAAATSATDPTVLSSEISSPPPSAPVPVPRPFPFESPLRTSTKGSGGLAEKPLIFSAQQASGRKQSRRGSIAVPLPTTTVSRLQKSRALGSLSASMPLAQREALPDIFETDSAANKELTARMEGRLSIAALTVVCSTRHYELLSSFLINSRQIRNGRPKVSISSVLENDRDQRRSLTVTTTAKKSSRPDFLSIARSNEGFSAFFDKSDDSDVQSQTVRLELNRANSDRSKVVRFWWRYLMISVVSDVRRRRFQRNQFKRQFLSFSWARTRYKRSTYVNLYIRERLRAQKSETKDENEELQAIEDILSVEQILLYRSIARALHVRGESQMPDSILSIRPKSTQPDTPESSRPSRGQQILHHSERKSDLQRTGEPAGLLETATELCSVAERRRDKGEGAVLEPFGRFVPWTFVGKSKRTAPDDLSTDDARTVRTFRTMKSGVPRGSRKPGDEDQGGADGYPMTFTFSLNTESIEVLIVQEESLTGQPKRIVESVGSSAASLAESSNMSDVSGLTDDQNSFRGGISVSEGDEISEPILTSTEFLLFRLPENVLLRVTMSPIQFSYTGRSAGTSKFDLTIGSVEAKGKDDTQLISVGERKMIVPVAEVDTGKKLQGSRGVERRGSFQPVDALSLSVAFDAATTVLQCDAPSISATVDIETLETILNGISEIEQPVPMSLLHQSPREKVRESVLKQNLGSTFKSLSCSVRFRGCDVSLPIKRGLDASVSDRLSVSGECSECSNPRVTSLWFHADMFEVYCGLPVEQLRGFPEATFSDDIPFTPVKRRSSIGGTRRLQMLDRSKLSNANIFSTWVATASGLDFLLGEVGGNQSAILSPKVSLLETPVDVESSVIVNSNAVSDINTARREISVQFSPVHFLLSERRAVYTARIYQGLQPLSNAWLTRKKNEKTNDTPLRLDVFSGSVKYLADINMGKMRVSLVTDEGVCVPRSLMTTEEEFKDAIDVFITVVSFFDLSYPNEEALSSAMQICIDRLTGLGLSLEDAWKATNTALLNFLQQMSIVQDSDLSNPEPEAAKSNAVHDTAMTFATQLMGLQGSGSRGENQIVIDFPNGSKLSVAELFYDRQITFVVPTVFVTDSAGIHIFRVTPPESESEAANESTTSGKDDTYSAEFGFCARWFEKDEGHPFATGGLPLSALGTDGKLCNEEIRIRDRFLDIESGDMDLLFSNEVLDGTLNAAISAAFVIFEDHTSEETDDEHKSMPNWSIGSNSLIALSSASVLFVADDFVPFCRVTMSDLCARSRTLLGGDDRMKVVLTSKSISVLNLTSEGELFPHTAEVLPEFSEIPFKVSYIRTTPLQNPRLDVDIRGVQVYFLRQFVYELLQYLKSKDYGIGRLRIKLRDIFSSQQRKKTAPSLAISVRVHDSSLLIPRSSRRGDLAAAEIEFAEIRVLTVNKSFDIPSKGISLSFGSPDSKSEFEDAVTSLDDHEDESSFLRTEARLDGLRLFIARSDSLGARDYPSFRYFYQVDGRAAPHKRVYLSNRFAEAGLAESGEIERLCWREITQRPVSLLVVTDFVPYLRLLLCDPPEVESNKIELDVDLHEFCLLLHLWYSNMKELPVLFPYAAQFVEESARLSGFRHPSLGSEACMNLLKRPCVTLSESAFLFRSFTLRCYQSTSKSDYFSLTLSGANIHVTNDAKDVTRVSCTSNGAELCDSRKSWRKIMTVGIDESGEYATSDLLFGVDKKQEELGDDLPQPFQLAVFMSPKWTLYNMGLQSASMEMRDFSTIFTLLDFFKAFFAEEKFENPVFEALRRAERIKSELRVIPSESAKKISSSEFRLWLSNAAMKVPCQNTSSSFLHLLGRGVWYKYAVIGDSSSQECVTSNLQLLYEDRSSAPKVDPSLRRVSLINGLSLGLRLDFNYDADHQDICIIVPYTNPDGCGLSSSRISLEPAVLSPPTICIPEYNPTRYLGPVVCEVTTVVEILPTVYTTLTNLFSGVPEEAEMIGDLHQVPSTSENSNTHTYSMTCHIADTRVFALDPVLGPHLPVAVVSLGKIDITASRFALVESTADENDSSHLNDIQLHLDGHVWGDYFRVDNRCWEPFLEAYRFSLLYEVSSQRGTGVSLTSDTALHVNVSSALLLLVDQVAETFVHSAQSCFSTEKLEDSSCLMAASSGSNLTVAQSIPEEDGLLVHELPRYLDDKDRVAFSIRNMTGQQIRLHRRSDGPEVLDQPASVSYVEHLKSMELVFQPSMSLVSNLAVVQVPFPGFPSSKRQQASLPQLSTHVVDAQLPGFNWLQDIKADVFGRGFQSLVPRSPVVLSKIQEDWRLRNMLKILAEVGLDKGGRQLTLRSIISVVNNTSHTISLCMHPDPTHQPGDTGCCGAATQEVSRGEASDIPTLLIETALQREGSHIGSIWFRPSENEDEKGQRFVEEFLKSQDTTCNSADVGFTSRPVQFAKMIGETSAIFEANRCKDVPPKEAFTNVQRSCPVLAGGRRLAPFCYAVEVARSPIVAASSESERSTIHGPVAYTLSIHPPIVIANLLPEPGRFELMHAVRRTVLWFGDLEPGQEVSVHSVGLDSPLLLLVDLGFCRTPVGEGALVHHGNDPPTGIRDNLGGLKSIGKAGKAVTKQLGKTLTALGESPDRRGMDKLQTLHHPQTVAKDPVTNTKGMDVQEQRVLGMDSGVPGKDRIDGNTYRVDTAQYFPGDMAGETSVVDGIGQRLQLGIENVRGGGGQRRISVFCPYWIVNTTEHALRYKQDKTKSFVSGTVLSPDKDGSIPLSGGHSRTREYQKGTPIPLSCAPGTVFSGGPGALATTSGRCDLDAEDMASLLDTNIALDKLASLSFMFNFHEGVISIGQQKLTVQLGDGKTEGGYTSEWSRGFSLESVGYSQVVSMHCKDGRNLEVLVVVSVAPGPLAGFTKIVRFLPRYVAVNLLPYPVRLWQDSSIFRPPSTADHMADDIVTKDHKWSFGVKKETRRVNQYEALWGREVVIDDRISSGTTAHPSAMYITTLNSQEIFPFTLPDSRSDRQLRLGMGGHHELTSSFASDVPGEHTLRVTPAKDLRLLKHVSTRASPLYEVVIPPEETSHGELGLWFETDWGSDRSLIVKNVKRNSFAYNQTDVHAGDELLRIDNSLVAQITFGEAMTLLRKRLNELRKSRSSSVAAKPMTVMRRSSLMLSGGWSRQTSDTPAETLQCSPLVLVFRTAEERLRRIRLKAARKNRRNSSMLGSPSTRGLQHANPQGVFIKVDMRTLHGSNFLLFREGQTAPYSIQNSTISNTIYYRQKGCNSHKWHTLRPGQTESYTWDEPLRPRRLTVRVTSENGFRFSRGVVDDDSDGDSDLEDDRHQEGKSHRTRRFTARDDEEAIFSSSITVRLEEIGWKDFLNAKSDDGSTTHMLRLEVQVVASARVLVVHDVSTDDDVQQMTRYKDALVAQKDEERIRSIELKSLRQDLLREVEIYRGSVSPDAGDPLEPIIQDAKQVMSDLMTDDNVSMRHQIQVEILEAAGLNLGNYLEQPCNPYAVAYLKSGSAKSMFRRRPCRRTYYVKQSDNPVWEGQSFVFDVPKDAAMVTRGHSLCIALKSHRKFGMSARLGKCYVDLHSLRDQKPLFGWFPLAGKSGGGELDTPIGRGGRGSVKLRVQWVYSIPALMDYFILLSERRLTELEKSLSGMESQLRKKRQVDAVRREGMEGMKAVRMNDLLEVTKEKEKSKFLSLSRVTRTIQSDSANLKSLSTVGKSEFRMKAAKDLFLSHKRVSKLRDIGRQSAVANFGAELIQTKRDALEAMFVERRRFNSSGLSSDRDSSFTVQSTPSGHLVISSFKSWVPAQVLLNDVELEHTVQGSEIHLRLQPDSTASEECLGTGGGIHGKLSLPPSISLDLSSEAERYATVFAESRTSFDTHARHELAVVTNPGGWLTIRPITALNLEDNFTGMYVKIRYGSETFTTSVADSRVYPTWYKLNRTSQQVSHIPNDDSGNDLHMYVAPQKTSGSIRVSVIGENGHQKLSSKSELGTVNLPLGAVISACTHSSTDDPVVGEDNSIPAYVRWFPLTRPKEAIPIAGDRGCSYRPPESEKRDDHQFKEYFAPCIQLALVWCPHSDEDVSTDQGDTTESTEEGKNGSRVVETYFNADIGRISAALLDSHRAIELLSCSVREVDVRYWVTKARTHFGVALSWLQLDNQIADAREAVILAPAPSNQTSNPVFHLLAVKDNIRSRSDVLSFQFIDVSVAEFDLTVEETFLIDLFEFGNSIVRKRQRKSEPPRAPDALQSSLWGDSAIPDETSLFDELFEVPKEKSSKVYIEQLFLGVVRVNLSYLKGKKQAAWDMQPQELVLRGMEGIKSFPQVAIQGGERLKQIFALHHDKSDVFLGWSQQTSDEDRFGNRGHSELKSLPVLVTSLLPNVSDAPIRLQGKALNHIFESPQEVLQSIRKYYVNETLRQVYKIIGSLDFVGNPAMLVSSFFSGVRDLVVAPSTAFLRSPTDASQLGLGVAKGTISLLSHSTSGFFGFASKVAAATGQGLATVSLDSEYRIWHRDKIVTEVTNMNREWKRRGVQSISGMVTRPIGDVANGILTGVGGLVIAPVKGYKTNGQIGLVTGVGRGCIGVFIKPTVGVLDALAHFSASVHDVAKSANVLEKRYQPAIKFRLPYTFGPMSILIPFDTNLSRASLMLQKYPMRKFLRESLPTPESVVHMEVLPNIGSDTFAVVTCYRMLLIKMGKEGGTMSSSLSWEIQLTGASSVSTRVSEHGHNGVALTVTLKKRHVEAQERENDEVKSEFDDNTESKIEDDSDHISDSILQDDLSLPADHDHGTGRGQEGELLEWFTVLAEYQYRDQLVKLHNSICCIVGDFESLMEDSSVCRTGSAEGLTTFGLYHFQPASHATLPSSANEIPVLHRIADLEWVFAAAINEHPPQQSSAETIAGTWLAESFIRAIHLNAVHHETEYYLPVIKEDRPFDHLASHNDLNEEDDLILEDEKKAQSMPDLGAAISDDSLGNAGGGLPKWQSPKETSGITTFFTPVSSDTATPRAQLDQAQQSSTTLQVENRSFQDSPSLCPSLPAEQNNVTQEASHQVDRVPSSSPDSRYRPGSMHGASRATGSGTSSDARMDRMEALMERLLIFSTEQSLTQHSYHEDSSLTTADAERMRRELAILRNQVEEHSKHEQETLSELESLREELNELRGQTSVTSIPGASEFTTNLQGVPERDTGASAAASEQSVGTLSTDEHEEWADAAAELSLSFTENQEKQQE